MNNDSATVKKIQQLQNEANELLAILNLTQSDFEITISTTSRDGITESNEKVIFKMPEELQKFLMDYVRKRTYEIRHEMESL